MHIYYEHPYGKIEKGFLQYVKVYAKPQSFEHQTALEGGFVYSNDHGKEIWLQTRNTRCVLSEFNKPDPVIKHLTVTHENKWSKLNEIVFKEFCNIKGFKMYEEDFYIIPEDNYEIVDDLVNYYYKDELIGWSKLRFFREASCFETNLFVQDYSVPDIELGHNSFTMELNWLKEKNHKYAYLGPGYEKSSIYKADIPGFEWWTGKEWSKDADEFKFLCKQDSKVKTVNGIINL